jgi:high-affinity iron transporter
MLATAIIIFREVLEAALVVSIVLAATKGVAGRRLWVGAGMGAGVLGAALVAAFAESISAVAAGMGQELFHATVLFLAVVMLGWHNVWMSRHGRHLATQMASVGRAVVTGEKPLSILAIVTGLAVLREGSEVVLFLYGIAAAGVNQANSMLVGGIAGLLAGVAVGHALYFGLLRIPTRALFTVTAWLILLVAAGMAAQGAGYLAQGGFLPSLGEQLWDSSAILSEQSIVGQLLHTLVGYEARPAGIQLLFYLVTLVTIGLLMQRFGRTPEPRPTERVLVSS